MCKAGTSVNLFPQSSTIIILVDLNCFPAAFSTLEWRLVITFDSVIRCQKPGDIVFADSRGELHGWFFQKIAGWYSSVTFPLYFFIFYVLFIFIYFLCFIYIYAAINLRSESKNCATNFAAIKIQNRYKISYAEYYTITVAWNMCDLYNIKRHFHLFMGCWSSN